MSDFTILLEPTTEGISLGEADEIIAKITGPKEVVLDLIEAGVDAVDGGVLSVTKYF